MAKMYVMCGVPGSGKSTFIKNFASCLSSKYHIVSRDEIRFKLLDMKEDKNADYFSCEDEVENLFYTAIFNSIQNEVDCFVDATHINKKSRRKLFKKLLDINKDNFELGFFRPEEVIAIYFETDLETCLKNNHKRSGRALVPDYVIKNMYNSYERPLMKEGFDWVMDAKALITVYLKEET